MSHVFELWQKSACIFCKFSDSTLAPNSITIKTSLETKVCTMSSTQDEKSADAMPTISAQQQQALSAPSTLPTNVASTSTTNKKPRTKSQKLSAIRSRIKRCNRPAKLDKKRVEQFRYNQLRYHDIDLSYGEAYDAVHGKVLSLQERYILASNQFNTSIVDKCVLCNDHEVNIFFSTIIEVGKRGTNLMFACDQCVNNQVEHIAGMRVRRSTSIDETRSRVWVKTHGLKLSEKCKICKSETITCNSSAWHVCHIDAKSKGGDNDISNYVAGCTTCNLAMQSKSVHEHVITLGVYKEKLFAISDDEIVEFIISKFRD